MKKKPKLSLGKIWPWVVIIISGTLSAYAAFICLLSVWMGWVHAGEAGFWVPLGFGSLVFISIVWFFFYAAKRLIGSLKDDSIFIR